MSTQPLSGPVKKPLPLLPLIPLTALLLIGGALTFMFSEETPKGRVAGTVILRDKTGVPLSECDVYLSRQEENYAWTPRVEPGIRERDGRSSYHTVTRKDGSFEIAGVREGTYTLNASSKWHSTADTKITVEEAKTVSRTLILKKSEAELSIGSHQTVFTTSEKPFLPVRGYVDVPGSKASATAKPKAQPMTVRVWRTKLAETLKRSEARDALNNLSENDDSTGSRVPDILLKPQPPIAAPTLVADITEPIKNTDREGFFMNRLPVPKAMGKPGLYLVEFTHGKYHVSSHVLVTDMALVSKRVDNEIVAYAANVQTGIPIAGANVRFYRNGSVVATQTTDASGVARLSAPALPRPANTDEEDPESADTREKDPILAASRGDDEAVVDRANWWYSSETQSYAVHTVTDRTIYRPGDTIQYKGIIRRRAPEGGPNNGYTIPRNVPVSVEIRDPEGSLVAKAQTTTSGAGTFSGNVEISPEGDTGSYSLDATVGVEAEWHSSRLVVASYRKPEFTVSVTPGKPRYLRGDEAEITIEGKYYFGTPVAGAKVTYYVYRDADWVREYGMSDPEFDPEESSPEDYGGYRNYYGDMVVQGEATLDSNGRAVVRFPTKREKTKEEQEAEKANGTDADEEHLPQAENFTLTATVVDDAKRSVDAEGAASVTASDFMVQVDPDGYLAAPGKASTITVKARDFDGKPLEGREITLKAEYWDWDAKAKKRVKTVLPGIAPQKTSAGGEAVFTVTPARTGELYLKATSTDSGGRKVENSGYLWVASDKGGDLDTDYDDLTLLTDKKRYTPGDTARILINTARTGQTILLTVEGDHVYDTRTVAITQRSTIVTLPVRKDWDANVVLAACYVRDKKFASSETPLRVTLKTRELQVSVKPDKETSGPGETITYTVTTTDVASGKPVPADFSLGVVDESIFALRADDPKALKREFYPRRSNRVSTSYSFRVEYLGDADKSEPQIEARRKFRDTAFWTPTLRTDANGQTTVRVALPDNLTTWRATVQAVSDNTAVGYGMSKVISRKPFFVRLEMPRYLTVGDETRLLGLVHNETGQAQNVSMRLTTLGNDKLLTFGADETKTLSVPAGGVGQVEWPVTVSAPGEAKLRITGWTPKAGTQYTDGIETSLTVRAYGRTNFQTFAGAVDANTPATPGNAGMMMATPGRMVLTMEGNTVPSETRLTLRVTPSVKGALSGGLEYLVGFPYGCTEQTMSRFYPDLMAQKLGLQLKATKAEKLPRMVGNGITRLRRMQKDDTGGWGWFENGADDAFLTAYVLTGLAEAKAQGYPVDETGLKRGRDAAAKMLDSAKPRQKPFLLYALALAGETDKKRLSYPFRYSTVRTKLELDKLPADALAYLVLLGKRIGEDYRPAWNQLQRKAVVQGRLIHWQAPNNWDDMTSDRMATATALRAMLAVEPQDEKRIQAVLHWLMQSRTDGYFGDTRDTAWVITALCDYLTLHPNERGTQTGQLAVVLNGKTVKTLDLAANTEPELQVTLPVGSLKPGPNTFELRPRGTAGTVFYAGALRQLVAAPTAGELPSVESGGVTVKREIVRVLPQKVGEDGWRLGVEDTKGRFQQGDRLRVRLTITAKKAASYVLIEDRFPSGCEISQRGTEEEVVESWGYWYDHVDVRDDRIAFFARNLPAGKQVIEYNLRAQTPGTSRALPTQVQGMYDAALRAESDSTRVEVGK
jgi:uncharacterized protein YfaS (alpha-2-macroglobulin family)